MLTCKRSVDQRHHRGSRVAFELRRHTGLPGPLWGQGRMLQGTQSSEIYSATGETYGNIHLPAFDQQLFRGLHHCLVFHILCLYFSCERIILNDHLVSFH